MISYSRKVPDVATDLSNVDSDQAHGNRWVGDSDNGLDDSPAPSRPRQQPSAARSDERKGQLDKGSTSRSPCREGGTHQGRRTRRVQYQGRCLTGSARPRIACGMQRRCRSHSGNREGGTTRSPGGGNVGCTPRGRYARGRSVPTRKNTVLPESLGPLDLVEGSNITGRTERFFQESNGPARPSAAGSTRSARASGSWRVRGGRRRRCVVR
jgi:hypothetical protein